MSEISTCPKCSAELPPNAPSGLCPTCLMRAGLEMASEWTASANRDDLTETTTPLGGFTPPEPDSLALYFPHLEISELLGHGGMGAVYKARQKKLDRLVALKIIRPGSAEDLAFAERFNREARTLARLNHPNIVGVHDFGEVTLSLDDGEDAAPRTLYYFLMEYVDGANLRQLIQGGELESESALAIITQICEALQFAHDEGVVHRDIKPENILVDTKGRVKIADFGLARLIAPTPQDFTLTGTNQVMGTPRYMAPEQMESSRSVDHRADIYSLGVVFYEMLTGELPVGPFDPPSQKADVDSRLDQVVLRALAREPDRRFQQASEMKLSVEEISSASNPPGFSTIAEREIQNAWHWIADDFRGAARRSPKLPALLMIMMSMVGGLMLLLPWMELEIDKTTTLNDVSVEMRRAVSRVYDGYELWSGMVTAAAFFGLALLMTVTPTKERLSVSRSVALTVISGLAVLLTILFQVELESSTYQFDPGIHHSNGETWWSNATLRNLEHRITYRLGFYGSLGLSAGLLLLSASGIRHATSQSSGSQTEGAPNTDPPLTSTRFTVHGERQEIGPQVVFHFTGLGYRLVDEQAQAWVFKRGRTGGLWAGICGTDIRELHTTLTVSSVPAKEGALLVNCVWAVHARATWIEGRDIKKLKTEGHQLKALLGDADDRTSADTELNHPSRYSVAAMIGAVLSVFFVAATVMISVVVTQNRVWLVRPIDWPPLLICVLVVGVAGAATTLVGVASISVIRASKGKVIGIGLAFTAAILFPLLLIDVIICGLLFVVSCLLFPESSFPEPLFIALMPMLWFLADALLIRFAWTTVSRAAEKTGNANHAGDHVG